MLKYTTEIEKEINLVTLIYISFTSKPFRIIKIPPFSQDEIIDI